MMQTKTKHNATQYINQNPLEALRDFGSGIAESVATDVIKGSANDLWEQLLGVEKRTEKVKQTTGDLVEGEEINFKNVKEKIAQPYDIEPGIHYRRDILHNREWASRRESQEVHIQIEQILVEIKQLAKSAQELEIQFKEVIVEQHIEKPGKYHLTFFEWVLTVLRTARMRVEDSASWLAIFASKKKQRNYWNMFKKHGTTFGLSNERVVATQTG